MAAKNDGAGDLLHAVAGQAEVNPSKAMVQLAMVPNGKA